MFGDIYPKYKGKSNWYIQEDEISVTTNLTILSQNLCCKQRKQDRVIDASFRLHGEFYAE